MISVKVEKEIKQENRVIGRFTLRQSICLGVSAALIALFAIIFRPSTDVLMGYIRLLNEYYDGCRKKDMASKKKRRQIKKQEAARKKKKSRLRAYL